jgi:hypothetical protein
MGNKGVQRRRRNALAANSGNLHKAQFGKATKFEKLPEAPKQTDFAQPLSKSTRRVQQMMVSPKFLPAPPICLILMTVSFRIYSLPCIQLQAIMASQASGKQQTEAAVDNGPEQNANEGTDCDTTARGQGSAGALHDYLHKDL